MAHCRIRMSPGLPLQVAIAADDAERVDVLGSEFFGGSAVNWYAPRAAELSINNCVFVGQTGLVLWCNGYPGAEVSIARSTFVNEHTLMLLVPPRDDLLSNNLSSRPAVIGFSMETSLVDSRLSMVLRRAVPPHAADQQIPQLRPFELRGIKEPALIAWSGDQNIYDAPQGFRAYVAARETVREPQSLHEDWQRLWRGHDGSSRLGEIRVDNGRESFQESMQDVPDAKSLNITRFENGRAIAPDAAPGALLRVVGPGLRYETWRNSMRADMWRKGPELP